MLKKLLNKKVEIYFAESFFPIGARKGMSVITKISGNVTDVDESFIELDRQKIISIKTIAYLELI